MTTLSSSGSHRHRHRGPSSKVRSNYWHCRRRAFFVPCFVVILLLVGINIRWSLQLNVAHSTTMSVGNTLDVNAPPVPKQLLSKRKERKNQKQQQPQSSLASRRNATTRLGAQQDDETMVLQVLSSNDLTYALSVVQPTDFIYASLVREWDAAPVVVEQFRLVFFTVPKNACTTWKMLFRRMNGAQNYQDQDMRRGLPHNPTRNGLSYLWDYSLEEANRIMTSTNYTRAIFVRDPKDRFLSAYLDKAVNTPDFLQRKCCPNTTSTNTSSSATTVLQQHRELVCSRQTLTPSQFLDVIHECNNAHWAAQSYRMEEKYWPFINFVGHHETVDVDAKVLLEQIGAWKDYGEQGWGPNWTEPIFHHESNKRLQHGTDSKRKYHFYFTPELERRVEKFYQVDYQNPNLGFSVDAAMD